MITIASSPPEFFSKPIFQPTMKRQNFCKIIFLSLLLFHGSTQFQFPRLTPSIRTEEPPASTDKTETATMADPTPDLSACLALFNKCQVETTVKPPAQGPPTTTATETEEVPVNRQLNLTSLQHSILAARNTSGCILQLKNITGLYNNFQLL